MPPPPGNPRVLLLATAVNKLGNGAYLTASTLFLTRSVGLTPAELAIGLSVAAVLGIGLSAPLGYVADRVGPRALHIGALLLLSASHALLVLVGDFWGYLPLACAIAVGTAASKGSLGALAARAVPAPDRLVFRAWLRSVNNGGVAVGALLGGLPLLLDTRAGYVTLLLANGGTYLLAALIMSRADRTPALARPEGPRLIALRDKPFMTFSLVDGVMTSAFNEMLSLALPLWLATQAGAPIWLVPAALVVNTVGCVGLQVWAARGVDGARDGMRIGRRGALVVGGSCVVYALTDGAPVWVVAGLVLGAGVVHVLGELWMSTASWAVIFGLAPEWAQGQYTGAYATGRQIGDMVTPPLLTALVVGGGRGGWIGLGVLFVLGGIVYPAMVRWGLRTRGLSLVGVR